MIEITENIKTEIGPIQDAEKDTRNIQAQFIEEDDVQTIEQYRLSGFDCVPPEETKHLTLDLGGGWKISFAENDGVEPDSGLDPGEAKVYSSIAGVVTAFMFFRKNGVIEINGDDDFAVRYSELETAFNQLKSDHNDLVTKVTEITQAFASWVVVPEDGGNALKSLAGSLGDPSASTADITPAKIAEIKVPS